MGLEDGSLPWQAGRIGCLVADCGAYTGWLLCLALPDSVHSSSAPPLLHQLRQFQLRLLSLLCK